MLTSLAYVFLAGLFLALVFERIKLPRVIGMLVAGVILGPYLLQLLDASLLEHSAAFRRMALVIILIKAGLTIHLEDLKKVGRSALLMSFLPACFELLAYLLFAPFLLGLSLQDAALLGSVMAAVSPAVVVPRMVNLIDKGYGTEKSIPQLILAGASLDDIVVIVLFTSLLSMAKGAHVSVLNILNIPISILMGVLIGGSCGLALHSFFKHVRILHPVHKILILLGLSFLLLAVETWWEGKMAISGLLAILAMTSVFKMKSPEQDSQQLATSFGNIWIAAELLLFVLLGAAVDIRYLGEAGLAALFLIFLALCVRSLGVLISISGSQLNKKEKLFTIIAYLPKATVQAAIASIPLATGLESGEVILSVAIIGIVITAPLGASLMDTQYKKLLTKDKNEEPAHFF